jgi:Transcriptional regulatory protein, C terminal
MSRAAFCTGASQRRIYRKRCENVNGFSFNVAVALMINVSSSGRRILACDDEPQLLRGLKVIPRGEGYEVLPAANMEEALDVAAVSPVEAAIIDLLLSEVWGPGYVDDTQVLRTHIARLRRKIEPAGVGAGFTFIPRLGWAFGLTPVARRDADDHLHRIDMPKGTSFTPRSRRSFYAQLTKVCVGRKRHS